LGRFIKLPPSKALNKLYTSGKFEFAVIYGRRRVGKTAIINEFTKNKPAICFTGVAISAVAVMITRKKKINN